MDNPIHSRARPLPAARTRNGQAAGRDHGCAPGTHRHPPSTPHRGRLGRLRRRSDRGDRTRRRKSPAQLRHRALTCHDRGQLGIGARALFPGLARWNGALRPVRCPTGARRNFADGRGGRSANLWHEVGGRFRLGAVRGPACRSFCDDMGREVCARRCSGRSASGSVGLTRRVADRPGSEYCLHGCRHPGLSAAGQCWTVGREAARTPLQCPSRPLSDNPGNCSNSLVHVRGLARRHCYRAWPRWWTPDNGIT